MPNQQLERIKLVSHGIWYQLRYLSDLISAACHVTPTSGSVGEGTSRGFDPLGPKSWGSIPSKVAPRLKFKFNDQTFKWKFSSIRVRSWVGKNGLRIVITVIFDMKIWLWTFYFFPQIRSKIIFFKEQWKVFCVSKSTRFSKFIVNVYLLR